MWQHLSRGLVRQQVQVQVQVQQVRHKKFGKFVVPHRKPRWIPMARSKMFVQPPKSLIPEVRSHNTSVLFLSTQARFLYE